MIILAILVSGLIAVFLIAPGDLSAKSHALLHGVCAQRASHSLILGGNPLPMDARMTGIYIGAVVAIGWVVALRRQRAMRVPSRAVLLILAGFVAIMAIDGLNALVADLGFPHPYGPSNVARLLTGTLAGLTLGIAVCHVFAVSVWQTGDRVHAVVQRPAEMLPPIAAAVLIALPALSGLPVLHGPYAFGLVVAVIAVFWIVCLAILIVGLGQPGTNGGFGELLPVGIAALGLAIIMLGGLAAARFGAEWYFGLPILT